MPKLFAHCHVKTATLRARDKHYAETEVAGWPICLCTNMPVNMHKVAVYLAQEAKTMYVYFDSKEIRPVDVVQNPWEKVEPWKSAPACPVITFFSERGTEITRWYFENETDRDAALFTLDEDWSNEDRAEQND